MNLDPDIQVVMDRFASGEYRPNKEESRELYRRLVRAHQRDRSLRKDQFPFTSFDCELMLDALSFAGFLDVHPSQDDSSGENAKTVWRFFLSTLMGIAVGAIVPNSNPVVIVGDSQHYFRDGDPVEDPQEQVSTQRFTAQNVCWVLTQIPFRGTQLLIDPLGWSIGESSEKEEIPAIMIAGLRHTTDAHLSAWFGDAYRTGMITRSYGDNVALLNISNCFTRYRISAWMKWRENNG